jgi:hypothetical protein
MVELLDKAKEANASDKLSGLFFQSISGKEEMFITLVPGRNFSKLFGTYKRKSLSIIFCYFEAQSCKTFYSHNLRMHVSVFFTSLSNPT